MLESSPADPSLRDDPQMLAESLRGRFTVVEQMLTLAGRRYELLKPRELTVVYDSAGE